MTPEAWIALAGLALALVIALGTFAVWISGKFEAMQQSITASRHKTMSDLQPKFAAIDEDIEKLGDKVDNLGERITRLEGRRG